MLRVSDLRTSFQTDDGIFEAVAGVTFDVARGESVGIVGESGCGKSVLVRSIMRLLPRSATMAGHVVLGGRDVGSLSKVERKHFWGPEVSMIFQDPQSSLNPVRKIGQQITDPLKYHLGLTPRRARVRAVELLNLVQIPAAESRLNQYPHELSGGMRQRIMIAIALSCQPKLLIADEPTTALDVTVQKQILDLLGQLQRDLNMAYLLITHDLSVVAGRTSRTLVMYAGQVAELASSVDLFDRPRHPYTEALLQSIPRLQDPPHTRLRTIAGRPPSIAERLVGCRFAQRCRYVAPCCATDAPLLEGPTPDHLYACHFPVHHADGARTMESPVRRTAQQ